MENTRTLTPSEKKFVQEQWRLALALVGRVCTFATATASRTGRVTNVGFNKLVGKTIVWDVTQELSKADGSGTVERTLAVDRLPL